jgi:hypothetical protein
MSDHASDCACGSVSTIAVHILGGPCQEALQWMLPEASQACHECITLAMTSFARHEQSQASQLSSQSQCGTQSQPPTAEVPERTEVSKRTFQCAKDARDFARLQCGRFKSIPGSSDKYSCAVEDCETVRFVKRRAEEWYIAEKGKCSHAVEDAQDIVNSIHLPLHIEESLRTFISSYNTPYQALSLLRQKYPQSTTLQKLNGPKGLKWVYNF